jgi:tryptophanyl-tRNA synthetase
LPEEVKRFEKSRKKFQETGDLKSLEGATGFVNNDPRLEVSDRERLLGYFKGTGSSILPEPQVLLTQASKLPGLDGAKMSKSYNNAIAIREDRAALESKVRKMPTDPARIKRDDPGQPERCTVWQFHQIYSSETTQAWVQNGCTSAGIGCLDCKQPIIEAILHEQQPMLERAQRYIQDPRTVRDIIDAGTERARITARETMKDVRQAMGLNY